MARFISGPVNWLRRSFSEHDGGLGDGPEGRSDSKKLGTSRLVASFDEEGLLPSLLGIGAVPSILSMKKSSLSALSAYFPSRILGSDLLLTFTTASDGFSLGSLYRRLASGRRHDTPVLLVILDTSGNTFGALVSEPFKVQESFYGTGQSFLFRLEPNFRVWPWSTENDFFISCSLNTLRIGAGDGHFGISLDGDLNNGRSQRCATYNNEPLVDSEDFIVKSLEIWTFTS